MLLFILLIVLAHTFAQGVLEITTQRQAERIAISAADKSKDSQAPHPVIRQRDDTISQKQSQEELRELAQKSLADHQREEGSMEGYQ